MQRGPGFLFEFSNIKKKAAKLGINNFYQAIFNPYFQRNKELIMAELSPIMDRDEVRFRSLLRLANAEKIENLMFDNSTDNFDLTYQIPEQSTIISKFKELDQEYKFFIHLKKTDVARIFIIFYKAHKIINDFIENNDDLNDEVYYLNAYKMLVLFGEGPPQNPFAQIETFLQNHNMQHRENTLSELLQFNLPINNHPISLKNWRMIISKEGLEAIKLFQYAAEIQRKSGSAPKDLSEAKTIYSLCKYQRAEVDLRLAKIAIQYNVEEIDFNTALSAKQSAKHNKNIPFIFIPGNRIKNEKYILTTFPTHDPHLYFQGKVLNNCLSIGSVGQQYILDGTSLLNNGFLVLLKGDGKSSVFNDDGTININQYEIVGSAYVWLSEDDNFVIDDWHNLRPESENIITTNFLKELGPEVTHITNASCLVIGINGGEAPLEPFTQATIYPETQTAGQQCSDSAVQALIYQDLLKLQDNKRQVLEILILMQEMGYFPTLFNYVKFKSTLENLTYYSPKYATWMKLLFTEKENFVANSTLFNTKNAESFLKALQQSGPLLLKVLAKLQQAKMLSEEHFKLILENLASLEAINSIIFDLQVINLLETHFNLLSKYPNNIDPIRDNLRRMINQNFSLELIKEILDNIFYIGDLVLAFAKLQENNLLTDFQTFIFNNKQHAIALSGLITSLKIFNVLDKLYLASIQNKPKLISTLNTAFAILSKSGASIEVPIILKHPQFAIELTNALLMLKKKGVTLDDVAHLIMSQPMYSEQIAKAVAKLKKYNLLIPENLTRISKEPDRALELVQELIKTKSTFEPSGSNEI